MQAWKPFVLTNVWTINNPSWLCWASSLPPCTATQTYWSHKHEKRNQTYWWMLLIESQKLNQGIFRSVRTSSCVGWLKLVWDGGVVEMGWGELGSRELVSESFLFHCLFACLFVCVCTSVWVFVLVKRSDLLSANQTSTRSCVSSVLKVKWLNRQSWFSSHLYHVDTGMCLRGRKAGKKKLQKIEDGE